MKFFALNMAFIGAVLLVATPVASVCTTNCIDDSHALQWCTSTPSITAKLTCDTSLPGYPGFPVYAKGCEKVNGADTCHYARYVYVIVPLGKSARLTKN